MTFSSPIFDQLIKKLRCLPGVGPKSAPRIALHILEKNSKNDSYDLASVIIEAIDKISRCKYCRSLSETNICNICNNTEREKSQLCVVESAIDLLAIERVNIFKGRYFVLKQKISIVEDDQQEDLSLNELYSFISQKQYIKEVIIAINPNIENQSIIYDLMIHIKKLNKLVSHIAYGIPFGGELEFADSNTLSHAFINRIKVDL
jgi:recombination protein RecR